MGAFVLLIVFQFSQGVSITSAEFQNKESCIVAGNQAVADMEWTFGKVRFSCSAK